MNDDAPRELGRLIRAARRTVVFTGAGLSTESGISDFRSPGGIWSRMSPIYFDDFLASAEARREAWRRKMVSDEEMRAAEPNNGHRVIASLVVHGAVECVITQNVDGLHQRSGVPEERLIELHGNATYAACLDCGLRHELGPIMAAFRSDEALPVCTRCDGIIKTATVSFGQAMPQAAMQRAERASQACDLFVAIGSSLVVYPAAALPGIANPTWRIRP